MKRLLSTLVITTLAIVGLGWALGQDWLPVVPINIEFDDAGFDYFDKEVGYIHLTRLGDLVTVVLNDVASPDAIELTFDEIASPDDEDDKDDIRHDALMAKVGIDTSFNGLELTFKDAQLSEVEDYFLTKMTDMNFTPVEEPHSTNTHVYNCGCNLNSELHLRLVLTRIGDTVYVSIKSV